MYVHIHIHYTYTYTYIGDQDSERALPSLLPATKTPSHSPHWLHSARPTSHHCLSPLRPTCPTHPACPIVTLTPQQKDPFTLAAVWFNRFPCMDNVSTLVHLVYTPRSPCHPGPRKQISNFEKPKVSLDVWLDITFLQENLTLCCRFLQCLIHVLG